MEQRLKEKLEQLKIEREHLIEYYENLERNLQVETSKIQSEIVEIDNEINQLDYKYREITTAEQNQIEKKNKASDFSSKLELFLNEKQQKGWSNEKSYKAFFKDEQNLKEAFFSGYFNNSNSLINETAKNIAIKYLKNKKNLQSILATGIEIRNIHPILPKEMQFDKDILIQATKEWMKSSVDASDYNTNVSSGSSSTYGILDMLTRAMQDPKISSDIDFVEVYNKVMNWRREQPKRCEEYKVKKQTLLGKMYDLEKEETKISSRLYTECYTEKDTKINQLDRDIQSVEKQIENEREKNSDLEAEILEIVETLKDNPLNVEMLFRIGKRDEKSDKVLEFIKSKGLLPICNEANEYYNIVECFKKGEILLRDIDEKYFNNEKFVNKIISISKSKLQAYVKEQTKDLKADEQIDPELLAKIKAQEDKIIKIIEEKKVLFIASKNEEAQSKMEETKSKIDNFEV